MALNTLSSNILIISESLYWDIIGILLTLALCLMDTPAYQLVESTGRGWLIYLECPFDDKSKVIKNRPHNYIVPPAVAGVPGGIDAMSPSSKEDFSEFEKVLKDKLCPYEGSVHYSGLLESLFQDLCISSESSTKTVCVV